MIYVDEARNRYGRFVMSHLFACPADPDELDLFAGRLGLRPEWRHNDHYDVCQSWRRRAIKAGAVPVSGQRLRRLVAEMRGHVR